MLNKFLLSASLILCGFSVSAESDTPSVDEGEVVAMEHEVDIEAAEKIFKKSCRACHGNKAQGAASYPKLSDKEPEYVAEKLERYRSGEKIGPNSILMIQHAKKLSDEDIANISIYVTSAFD
ncbi:c-type cytochrome [Falsihalocynthiibacter sp. SS001]|uniref:c-type cytochrome n=1 Tax=Falsihalocynthiibacter sp. SS001 TaxID=3349698 RepID=UPI0036D31009